MQSSTHSSTHITTLCVVTATGADAQKFLHGQLTNHVEGLPNAHAQRNSWLTAKGRMLANFWLVRFDADSKEPGYAIIMPRELVEATVKRLRMFVLRSKCVLTVRDDLFVNATLHTTSDVTQLEHYPVSGNLDAFSLDMLNGIQFEISMSAAEPTNDNDWQLACITAAEPWVVNATTDHFVPQMINFDVIHGVHFKKGCYPGQEIVHRTKMLGRVRRRMIRATVNINSELMPKVGDPIYSKHFGDQAAGMIVCVAHTENKQIQLLVSALLEGIHANDLSLTATGDSALVVGIAPYAVPELVAEQ
jgi:tRNA-modifying protein YgfZ